MSIAKHGSNRWLSLALVVVGLPGLARAKDWSGHDWAQEEIELSQPGETTARAIEAARQASAASPMRITLNAVGFDIPAGSTAETYLQRVAQSGGGGYFRAEAGGDLTAALGQAATGQPATPSTSPLVVCRAVVNGEPQGAADHFPTISEVWVQTRFTNLPEGTVAQCVWLAGAKELMRSERAIGGQSGWVAFSIRTTAPQGFSPGVYTVRITAGGQLLGERQFRIGPP